MTPVSLRERLTTDVLNEAIRKADVWFNNRQGLTERDADAMRDVLCDALLALETPELTCGTWQSMATAPKDGRWILVWQSGCRRPCVARWYADWADWTLGEDRNEVADMDGAVWMPLPPIPARATAEQE